MVSPKAWPAWNTLTLASAMSGFLANFFRMFSSCGSGWRLYSQYMIPSAK